MITLGVTGGIGSGKSAFAARLARHPGVRVVLADDLAKRLMATDPGVRAAVVARFGPETYRADGTLDRAALAARVFGQPDELAALNAIVHPAVRRAVREAAEAARTEGVRLFVYETALLFETGADVVVDHVALVTAPEAVRLERAMERDGLSEAQVRTRMAEQIDAADAEARTRALGGTVVDNGGALAALDAQAEALVARLGGDAS